MPWLAPALAVAVALAVRLWALRGQPFVTVDGTEYIRFAEALAAGRAFVSIFPPGYPMLIALARLALAERVLAAALVSLVCGALLPLPVWWLARRAVGARWALVPALAVALHPELSRFSAIAMSESPYFLALYGGLALAAAARTLPAGLALGAAFAIRPEALVPAGALVARTLRGRTAWRAWVLGATGFLALAVPCWLWFHATLGEWTLTPKLGALKPVVTEWRTDEPRLRAPATPRHQGPLETLAKNGPAALRQYPSNALAHGRSLLRLWPAPLLLLALAGLARRRGMEAVALLHLAAIPFLGLSAQPRFVLGALPALAVLATVPLAAPGRARAAAAALWAIGAVGCGLNLGRDFVRPFDGWIDAQQKAGIWLSGVAEADAVVMDRKPYVAFYARRPYRVMPDEPYDALIAAAVGGGVRYLVVDQKIAEVYRRQLEPLLYDATFRDRERRLQLVYVGGRQAGYGLGIFRVLGPGEAKSDQPPFVDGKYLRPAEPAP
ncbi:MAG: hypothetical protein HZC42_11085 [Candidatus Eisenbacteria bacterium]|nr:hypothetical protein [Candidatus Eisenbacteria bacterium]